MLSYDKPERLYVPKLHFKTPSTLSNFRLPLLPLPTITATTKAKLLLIPDYMLKNTNSRHLQGIFDQLIKENTKKKKKTIKKPKSLT